MECNRVKCYLFGSIYYQAVIFTVFHVFIGNCETTKIENYQIFQFWTKYPHLLLLIFFFIIIRSNVSSFQNYSYIAKNEILISADSQTITDYHN